MFMKILEQIILKPAFLFQGTGICLFREAMLLQTLVGQLNGIYNLFVSSGYVFIIEGFEEINRSYSAFEA